MQNNFKNPFELDEEDTMITLDSDLAKNKYISQPIITPPIQQSNTQPKPKFQLPMPSIQGEKSMFDPLDPNINQSKKQPQLNQNDDPPLLQDIGIDLQMIKRRMIKVLTFGEANRELIQSPDLSGPILISFLLAFLLLLGGKMHFSDIETGFILGNIAMYFLFNFMSKTEGVSLYIIMSFLGYSLLPMLLLALFGIFIQLNGPLGILSSLCLSIWSSYTASDMISLIIDRSESKSLVTYPLFLFYLSFALIIIF